MESTEKPESSYYSLSNWDRHPSYHDVAIGKVAEQHILTKCLCNTFQVISDLLHDFIKFTKLH